MYFCILNLQKVIIQVLMAGKKKRYTDKELSMFDDLIVEKLTKATEQLSFYERQLSDLADNPDTKSKALDDATGSMEAERISELAVRLKKYITHLQNARLRISNKVYGICRVTGELISKERLKAVPHATLSIKAKQSRM
jgi:RNA polymerase-binding transcription factor DksA